MADIGMKKHHRAWWRVLLGGVGIYAIGLIILVFTGNPNMFPTVVLVGSFLVPVAFVVFFYERRHITNIGIATTFQSFLYGGILGTFAASIIEPLVVHRYSIPNAFVIGLIEEFVKIIGVVIIAVRSRRHNSLDGLILGAAAGMGFAAFESTGYAFTAFMASGGSLSATVGVTMLRAALSPFGHGTWTAILAAVLFRESAEHRLRIDLAVFSAYLGVSVLHGMWDSLPEIISSFVGSGIDVLIGQVLVGAASLVTLWLVARKALREQPGGERLP